MQYSFLAVEQVIVMTVCIIASHHELILALQLKPSRKNLHFLKLAKTGSSRFYSGNRINQLQFFSSLCSKQNKTSCYSCKSTCETAPKSLSWALIYAPGFEYPPWLALSTCQSGWREIWNAFTIFICWVHWGPRIRISSTTLQMFYCLSLVKSATQVILSCCFQFLLWQLPFLLEACFVCIKAH